MAVSLEAEFSTSYITPGSDWRSELTSGYKVIEGNRCFEHRPSSRPMYIDVRTVGETTSHDMFITVFLSHQPWLRLDQLKRIAQATCYFNLALARMLNPGASSIGFDEASWSAQRQAINEIENESPTFSHLPPILERFYQKTHQRSVRLQTTRNKTNIGAGLSFPTWHRDELPNDKFCIEQVDLVIAFAEAALAWSGGGLKGLQRWPMSIIGLGRFLGRRGNSMESTEDGKAVKTPFISSFPASSRVPAQISLDRDLMRVTMQKSSSQAPNVQSMGHLTRDAPMLVNWFGRAGWLQ